MTLERGKASSASSAGRPIIDIYASTCLSTEDSRGRSVSGQVEDGVAYIHSRGADVGEVFQDERLHVGSPRPVRAFDRLMDRLDSGQSDGVWMWGLTRFTSETLDGERLLAAAEHGALVWSLDQEHELTTTDGRRAFREAMVAAEDASDRISERVSPGNRRKSGRGRSNASHRAATMPGFLPNREGWLPGFLPNPMRWLPGEARVPVPDERLAAEVEAAEVDAAEVDAVREVAAMLLAGRSLADAAHYLNERNLLPTSGLLWSPHGVRQMLQRGSLAGIAGHHAQGVGRLDREPVLDRETWERVQDVIASRRRGGPVSEQYLLSGVLICGRCGTPLVGRSRVSRAHHPDGEKAREYRCERRLGSRSGCGRLSIDMQFADDLAEALTIARLAALAHGGRRDGQAAEAAAELSEVPAEAEPTEGDATSLAAKAASRTLKHGWKPKRPPWKSGWRSSVAS